MKKQKIDHKFDLPIHDLGSSAEGVGYYQGYTVFVDGALPGEIVHTQLFERQKRYGRGHIIEMIKTSPDRVIPPCSLFGKCGGCQLMHLSYSAQLAMKQKRVADALERIGKIENLNVAPCVPSPSPFGYRNKIQLPVKMKDGKITLGLYERGSHNLVEVEKCQIHCELGEEVMQNVADVLKNSKITAYDINTGKGELRHVIIKSALYNREALVVLVTSQEDIPALTSVAKEIRSRCKAVKGVIQNINKLQKIVVLGDQFKLLDGLPYIQERVNGLLFNVSAASFFQINPLQADNLYAHALEFAELTGDEHILDAYCGVGTLSLIFAQKAKRVTGVECVAEAIADAKENATQNGINNVEFVCAHSEEYIGKLSELDLVLLNPTRRGCDPAFLHGIGRCKPKKVIYISCDPATLARDLLILQTQGYKVDRVLPFDMFPQTAHVETLVLLTLT